MAGTGFSPLSLRRNFSWTLVGNGIYAACKWLNVLLLAKLGRPESVGLFALGLAVCAPVMLLTDLHLRTVQATDARREHRFSDYLRLRVSGILLGWLLIAALALTLYRSGDTPAVLFGVALVKGAESLADVFYGLFQQRERMDRVARSLLAKGLLGSAAFGTAFAATARLLPAILALGAALAVVFLVYDLPGALRLLRADRAAPQAPAPETGGSPRLHERLGGLALLALPMGIVMMLNSLYVNIPRYAIERFEGTAALGIFSALAYLVGLGSLFVGSLGQTASPRLAQYFAAGDRPAFSALLQRLVGLVLLLGIGGVALAAGFGRPLLTRLYNAEYAMESELFVWLMIVTALSFLGAVLGTAVTAMRRFRIQVLLQAGNVVLITTLSYPLIERFGLRGAAWAMLGGSAAMILAYGWLVRRALQSPGGTVTA